MAHQHPGQRPESTSMPRWVKVSLIVLAALALLGAVALLSGHGPARHGSAAPVPETAPAMLFAESSAAWL